MAKGLKKKKETCRIPRTNATSKRGGSCEQYPAISYRHITTNSSHNFEFLKNNDIVFQELNDRIKEITSDTYTHWLGLNKYTGIEMMDYWQIKFSPSNLILSKDEKIIIFRFYKQDYRMLGIRKESCPTLYIIGFDFDYSAYKH